MKSWIPLETELDHVQPIPAGSSKMNTADVISRGPPILPRPPCGCGVGSEGPAGKSEGVSAASGPGLTSPPRPAGQNGRKKGGFSCAQLLALGFLLWAQPGAARRQVERVAKEVGWSKERSRTSRVQLLSIRQQHTGPFFSQPDTPEPPPEHGRAGRREGAGLLQRDLAGGGRVPLGMAGWPTPVGPGNLDGRSH